MSRNKKIKPLKRKKHSFRKILKIFVITILALVVTISVYIGIGIKNEKYGELPAFSEIKMIEHAEATEIFTSDSVLMGRYYYQNRNNISSRAIPEKMINALVSTEDARFYEHNGIDYKSLIRVIFKTVLLGDRSAGGGSTITQQLAKNLYPRDGSSFIDIIGCKIREMIIARRMEKLYEKDKIIQLYLNTVPFGENTYGVKNAAQLYFGEKTSELSTEQVATLIGMLKATHTYNPHKFPQNAIQRRNVVLSQMAKYGYLTERISDSLKNISLNTNYRPVGHNEGIAPYFREYLRGYLTKWCQNHTKKNGESYNLYSDGLKIYTTIDSEVQQSADKAIKKHMPALQNRLNKELGRRGTDPRIKTLAKKKLESQLSKGKKGNKRNYNWMKKERPMEIFSWDGIKTVKMSPLDSMKYYLKMLQTGFIALNPQNGNILAWVGGINHRFFKYDHVLSERQLGSVFKPVVYMEALRQGIKPCDYYPNDSISYESYNGWTPRNAEHDYGGVYSVQGALVNSINTVSVQLLLEAGIDSVINMAKKLGYSSGEMPHVPSLALGTTNSSVLNVAKSYGIMANGGNKIETHFLKSIKNNKGEELERFIKVDSSNRILPPEMVEQMTMMLNNVTKRGTGSSLIKNFNFPGDIAGKTGTTQNHADGWFVGYNPKIVLACWVGADSPEIHFRNIWYGQGAATALPITGYFLEDLSKKDPEYFGRFKFSEIDTSRYNCLDYREKAPGLIEKLFNIDLFKKNKKEKKEKKGVFKKIFKLFKRKNKKDSLKD